MERFRFVYAAVLGSAWVFAWATSDARACTAFLYAPAAEARHFFLGKSFDFTWGRGFVTKNPRGLAKTSILKLGETSARWVARYGSLTFNQMARGMPQGGINERGLVVEALELPGAVYPPRDGRPVINELQWVQYQLDLYASVGEVLAHLHDVRLNRLAVSLHYLVCDRGGACAVVEPLGGAVRARAGSRLPVPVLANEAYAESLAAADGGDCAVREDVGPAAVELSSSRRFTEVSCGRRALTGARSPVNAGFRLLENVRTVHSPWTIVYDLTRGAVYFRSVEAPALKRIRLAEFDFACAAGSSRLDVNASGSGDVSTGFGSAGYAEPGTAEHQAWTAITHAPAYFIQGVIGLAHAERCEK